MASLIELASGLKTELETRHFQCGDVTLIGHSLGGLIIRQYVLSEIKAGRTPLCNRVLLYAVPNTGAGIAAAGKFLSWNHRHLAQLCKDSDVIGLINDDWINLRVEENIHITYIIGGSDAVVSGESARLYRSRNSSMLIGETHKSIVLAEDLNDTRYLVLKKTILGTALDAVIEPPKAKDGPETKKAANPLFDTYNISDEEYYVERNGDVVLRTALAAGHVWVHGESGVGKTASVVRSGRLSGWQLRQILLAGYDDKSAGGLLWAICVEISDFAKVPGPPTGLRDSSDLIKRIRDALRALPKDAAIGILIDEFPLSHGPEMTAFLGLILQLSSTLSVDSALSGRVSLAFISIPNPEFCLSGVGSKLAERIQCLSMQRWSNDELVALIERLAGLAPIELDADKQVEIVHAAGGSPRFVKLLFRQWRNGTAGSATLGNLLRLTKSEMV